MWAISILHILLGQNYFVPPDFQWFDVYEGHNGIVNTRIKGTPLLTPFEQHLLTFDTFINT